MGFCIYNNINIIISIRQIKVYQIHNSFDLTEISIYIILSKNLHNF